MRNPNRKPWIIVAGGRSKILPGVGALFALLALPVLAQVGGGFDLSWSTVDGGGSTVSSGGAYSVGGTIGQPDAGTMSGGAYQVSGGFWSASTTLGLVAHVTWQGPPAQPNAAQQLPITLTLKLNTGTTERNYASQSTDASGYFSSSTASLVGGAYNWRVKGPKYLASAGTVTLGGSGTVTSTLEMGLMRAGDADDDNLVSASDFNILRATFGKACGAVGYDDRADFTGNCLVDASDFNVMRANFGTSGAPPLRPGGP